MAKAIYTKLISIYNDLPDGFLILRGDSVLFANDAITRLCGRELTNCSLNQIVGYDTAKIIWSNLKELGSFSMKDVAVADKQADIKAVNIDDSTIIIFKIKTQDETYKEEIKFLLKTMWVMAKLQYDNIMSIDGAVSAIKGKSSEKEIELLEKYFKSIMHANRSTEKNIKALCDFMSYYLNGAADNTSKTCNVVQTLGIIKRLSEKLIGEDRVKISLAEMPNSYIISFDTQTLQSIIYAIISAFLHNRKQVCEITVELSSNKTLHTISFIANGVIWNDECVNFAARKRYEYLPEDIQKYGYDILRAQIIARINGGKIEIKSDKEKGTKISVGIPIIESNELEFKTPLKPLDEEYNAIIELIDIIKDV